MLPSHSDQVAVIARRAVLGAPSDLAAALAERLFLRREQGSARILLESTDNDILSDALHDAAPGCKVTVSTNPLEQLSKGYEAGSFDAVIIVGDMLSVLLAEEDAGEAAGVLLAQGKLLSVAQEAKKVLAANGMLYVECPPHGPSCGERRGVPVSNEPELAADVEWEFLPDTSSNTQVTNVCVRVHGEPEVRLSHKGLLVGESQLRDASAKAGFSSLEAVPTPKGSNEVLKGYVAKIITE